MTNPYGQPAYGAPSPQPHPRGVPVLILGIIGVVLCGPCAIVALVLAQGALKEIDQNPSAYSNRGMVNAGRILGIIGIILWIVVVIGRLATMGNS